MKNNFRRRLLAAVMAIMAATLLLIPAGAEGEAESGGKETGASGTREVIGDGLHTFTCDENGILDKTGNGIQYSVNDDNTVTVHGYNDTLDTLTIPGVIDGKTVTEIAATAFYGNLYLKTIILPASVIKIGEDAFSSAAKLRKVQLPDGLKEIPKQCFRYAKKLREVNLPAQLETIGDRAFEGCPALKSLEVPASVTKIGEDVFSGCENLIFHCENNAYAKEYAASHALVTRFADSNTAVMLKAGTLTVVFGAAAFLGAHLYRRNQAKKKAAESEKS